jgi:hypothetical protein
MSDWEETMMIEEIKVQRAKYFKEMTDMIGHY